MSHTKAGAFVDLAPIVAPTDALVIALVNALADVPPKALTCVAYGSWRIAPFAVADRIR